MAQIPIHLTPQEAPYIKDLLTSLDIPYKEKWRSSQLQLNLKLDLPRMNQQLTIVKQELTKLRAPR